MRKMIACPPGEWAKKLLTISRLESIEYFLDEKEGIFYGKTVYGYERLLQEDKDNIIVIVTDSKAYGGVKYRLESYGLKENVHFFNGWKLNRNFYQLLFGDGQWTNIENMTLPVMEMHRRGWQQRAESMARLIPDDVGSIMDIGCGEGLLKKFLPERIKYYGLDYCKRDADTIVCDLDKDKLPEISVDAYYLAGVINYISDIRGLMKQFVRAKYVILSLSRTEPFIRLDAKECNGVTDCVVLRVTTAELINAMYENGFICSRMVWEYEKRDEYYFVFENINRIGRKIC